MSREQERQTAREYDDFIEELKVADPETKTAVQEMFEHFAKSVGSKGTPGEVFEELGAREKKGALAELLAASREAASREQMPRTRPASTVKVTVNLPEEMAANLKDLAERESKTFTQVLKEAISLKLFLADVLRRGGKLLVEYADKKVERIVFH